MTNNSRPGREQFENWLTSGQPESTAGKFALKTSMARDQWPVFETAFLAGNMDLLIELEGIRQLWLNHVRDAPGERRRFEKGVAMGLLIAANVIDGRLETGENIPVPEFEVKEIDD